MEFRKFDISREWNPIKAELMGLYNKRAEESEKLQNALKNKSIDAETAEAIQASLNSIKEEAEKIASMLESWDEPADKQPEGATRGFDVYATTEKRTIQNNYEVKNMENNNNSAEIRSFQRYISAGINSLQDEEKRSLNLAGAGAVLPVTIYNELITSGKYSDLLHRAKVFNEPGAGKLYIPIASNTAASWHTELEAGNEASPDLTRLELGGYELMRLMSMSAAAASMTEAGFENTMLQLLSSEVIETLEQSFIKGTGSGQPKGLENLTWITSGEGQNAIETSALDTDPSKYYPISAPYVAEALSLLPQKYARGAILLMNAKTAAVIARQGWSEESICAYNATESLVRIYGHEVVISEHVGNDTVYVVDPKELYVRFSMPVQIEANRSSGFTSARVDLRAIAVVDACWNPAACVRLTEGVAS